MRDRGEARAHGVERRSGSEKPGGGGRAARVGRRAAPGLPAFSGRAPAARSLPALVRPALRIRPAERALRAQNVAADMAPAPASRALALGAGTAGPGRRGAVPRQPAAWVPRTAQRQKQVSAWPLLAPRTAESRGPPTPPRSPAGPHAARQRRGAAAGGPPSGCRGGASSAVERAPLPELGVPGDLARAPSGAASRTVRRGEPTRQGDQETPRE